MRLYADWMVLADERILEFLQENGPASPSEMADDARIGFSREYLGRRCREYLRPYGLVSKSGQGVYFITEDGEAYLAGDLDADDLDTDDAG